MCVYNYISLCVYINNIYIYTPINKVLRKARMSPLIDIYIYIGQYPLIGTSFWGAKTHHGPGPLVRCCPRDTCHWRRVYPIIWTNPSREESWSSLDGDCYFQTFQDQKRTVATCWNQQPVAVWLCSFSARNSTHSWQLFTMNNPTCGWWTISK